MKAFLLKGLLGKAYAFDLFECEFINIRDFATNKHQKVDDRPFGGNHGMLLKVDILAATIRSIPNYQDYSILYTCPKGTHFNQETAQELSQGKGLIVLSGYYEGVDERIFDLFDISRVSLGDFVLSSGDIAALAIAEATLRLIPGVVGKEASVKNDSIINGRLEHPYYTQPREFEGLKVPDVLISGHHGKIKEWQSKISLKQTLYKRPDLLYKLKPTTEERKRLTVILKEKD